MAQGVVQCDRDRVRDDGQQVDVVVGIGFGASRGNPQRSQRPMRRGQRHRAGGQEAVSREVGRDLVIRRQDCALAIELLPTGRAGDASIQRETHAIEGQQWSQRIGNGPQQLLDVTLTFQGVKDGGRHGLTSGALAGGLVPISAGSVRSAEARSVIARWFFGRESVSFRLLPRSVTNNGAQGTRTIVTSLWRGLIRSEKFLGRPGGLTGSSREPGPKAAILDDGPRQDATHLLATYRDVVARLQNEATVPTTDAAGSDCLDIAQSVEHRYTLGVMPVTRRNVVVK